MWAWNLFTIWVTMWCAPEVEPHKHNNLPRAGLIFALCKIYPAPAYIQQKVLTFVNRGQRDAEHSTQAWIIPALIISADFLDSDQGIGFSLREIDFYHQFHP